MIWEIALVIFKTIFSRWLAKEESAIATNEATAPYKAESEALAAAPVNKPDTVQRLRSDVDLLH